MTNLVNPGSQNIFEKQAPCIPALNAVLRKSPVICGIRVYPLNQENQALVWCTTV